VTGGCRLDRARAGPQHAEAYRAINPRRVVPTWVLEDGTAIGEVPVILRYIEEVHPHRDS
jgi:glutathione S-transferase